MAKSLEDMSVPELLAHTRGLEEKSGLLDTLLSTPATRKDALKLVKTARPNMPIPELDAEAAMDAKRAEDNKRLDDLAKQVQERDIRDRIDRERARVMKTHGLTDEQMVEVEKLMVDESAPIPHYDAAAKVYKASQLQAAPTPAALAPRTWEMPEKDVWKGGIGNRTQLDRIATNEAYKALNEIRSGKVQPA